MTDTTDTTTDDSSTDPDDLIDELNQATPDDRNPLADDLDASIGHLSDRVDWGGGGPNPMPISPEQGIAMLRPMIASKADRDPENVLRTLAILHLETGALLDKHSDLDPVELVA